MKKYIDAELNSVKVNVIDLQKENYKPSPTIDEILLKLYISKEDYYQALSISVDDDYELHLIRPPNSCFVNNHFDRGLRPWQANMDIQPVFNEYTAVAYMCSYFSKSEDKCSFAMKQVAQEAFEAKLDQFNTMKNIYKAYTSNRECSAQEDLRRVFPVVQFVNTNLPEERSNVLLAEKQISFLPEDSTNIFRRNSIDRYIARPSVSFCDGLYSILDSFCFAYSHKKRKDSLEGSLDGVSLAAELEFPKILVPSLPQHTSNVNIECVGKSRWSKQQYSL